jgi:hypothetical protein
MVAHVVGTCIGGELSHLQVEQRESEDGLGSHSPCEGKPPVI